ncbi:MAG: HNH endonuclease [Syntrophobacteraceae bacterium CG2_30_61_12]|nr:MAG: HNH endonuclease [Syntrophobacteraceae bacterium CG2_30_61_12]PIU31894.1 MAG: HNH endonuclease [Syntrophobacteraceae bacterium CG07_land_8_20_14_0_80_61_8]
MINELPGFLAAVPPQALRKEKEKARALRRTQWWRRQLDKGRCHYCGRPVARELLTMDHVVPLARGGRSTRGNLVPCCKDCNNKKKYLVPIEWEKYMERLGRDADRTAVTETESGP